MIKIKKSKNADSRTSDDNVTIEQLKENTKSHMFDVNRGCEFISDLLLDAGDNHDYTKLAFIEEFYEDFSSGKTGKEFKNMKWFQKHLKERHHLNDCIPEDVNLIDVIEMVVDCCMAGLVRSGSVSDVKISNEILQLAVKNTQDLIVKNTEIVD